jgi:hypothetical protein
MSLYTFLKFAIQNRLFTNLRDPAAAEDYRRETRRRIEVLAAASGGRVYFPKNLEEVASVYEQIGEELRRSYSFGYASDAKVGTTHRIELRVSEPGLRIVQSRESYTAQ